MVNKVNSKIVYSAAHPDIPLPDSELVEIGTAFTAAKPATAEGWTFEGWYTDYRYTNKWVDGTVITGDLNLFGKWSNTPGPGPGPSETTKVSFAYSSNSDSTEAALPGDLTWQAKKRIYPVDLPALPVPTSSTVTVSGWYIDKDATSKITSEGVLVPESGLTLYAKSNDSEISSVSFAYSLGRLFDETATDYPMPVTATAAWDAETLGDDSVLPDKPLTGKAGETVTLPTGAELGNLFPGTDCEAEFKGFYTSELAEGSPVTQITLGDADQVVYALYEPKNKTEFVDITYKVAKTYIPKINSAGEIVAAEDTIKPREAASLMPALAPAYVSNSSEYEDEEEIDITKYEWHDKVIKGSEYRLALPQNCTERTDGYVFAGYFSDEKTENEIAEEIPVVNSDLTVYCKFVAKSEKVLPGEGLPKTHNISFDVDAFASSTDLSEGGLLPPDMHLPPASMHQPVDINKEAFPDLIDAFIPKTMKACEGFQFKGFYFYDDSGKKVSFVPGVTEVTKDLTLYPEFEILKLEQKTTIMLAMLTPDTLAAPEDLTWRDVPTMPFSGITNPMVVNIGATFDTATIKLPGLQPTFQVDNFYTLEKNNNEYELKPFVSGTIAGATTLFVRFKSTIAKPLNVVYMVDDTDPDKALVAPDFDYELCAASDLVSGNFQYEPRPADIFAKNDVAVNSDKVLIGYYKDKNYTQLFDPETATQAGGTALIYPKIESSSKIMVTVDYIPPTYSLTGSKFAFEIPTAPELTVSADTATTYTFDVNTTGDTILKLVGDPPVRRFWKPNVHEYGNCYWYTKASDEAQIPQPFNPTGFKLTESISLFPQFIADMLYPVPATIVQRDDIKLTLNTARTQAGAIAVSSN